MKETKLRFSLLTLEFDQNNTILPNDSPPVNRNSPPTGIYDAESAQRKETPVNERSEMLAASEESVQTKVSNPQKQKTSCKKVVLAAVLAILAIIGACTANMALVDNVFEKLVHIL